MDASRRLPPSRADCHAFTWVEREGCEGWLPGAPGCCVLKYKSGWSEVSGAGGEGYTSGVLPDDLPKAKPGKCELAPETDLPGGALQLDPAYPSIAVARGTADACCNACALVEGCGAFTLASSDACWEQLGANAVACCFLVRVDWIALRGVGGEGGWAVEVAGRSPGWAQPCRRLLRSASSAVPAPTCRHLAPPAAEARRRVGLGRQRQQHAVPRQRAPGGVSLLRASGPPPCAAVHQLSRQRRARAAASAPFPPPMGHAFCGPTNCPRQRHHI